MAYQGGVAPNLSRQGSHHSLHGPQGHDTFASHHRLQPANLNQSARNDPRSQSQILGHMTGQTHSQNPHKYVSQPNLSHHESDRRHYGSQQISPKPAYQPIRPQEQSSKPEYRPIRADNEPQYSSQQNLSPTNQKPQYQPIRPRNSEGSNLSRPVSLQNLSLEQQWKLVRSESTKSVSGLRPKVQNYAQNQPSPSSPQGQRAVYPEEASPQSTSPKYPPNQSFSRHESEAPPPYQREPEQMTASHQNPQYASQQNGFSTHDSRRSLRSQTSPYPSRKDAKSPPHTTPQMSRKGSEYSHAQRSVRTQQSAHSQMSLASSGSGAHPIPEARGTEASHIIEILKKEIVYLTGGRDRQGGPVLTFPPQPDNPDFNSHDITICLKYLLQIPSEESKRRGFTAIVDSRDGSWQNLVTVLGCLKQSLGDYMKQVLVLKADQQMDRRSSSSSFRRDRNNPNLEPQFVNLQRLHTYVDKNQLTHSYGGLLWYHHPEWLQNRIDLEKFIRESRAASSHLDDSETQIHQVYSQRETLTSPLESLRQHRFFQESIMSVPNQVIRDGHDLLTRLKLPGNSEEDTASTLDNLEEQKQVKRLITYLENRVDKLQNLLEDRDRSLSLNLQYEEFQRNVKHVVSWILGPGEKLLASQVGIGDSYLAAEELRKRHEEMEIKCTDTYGQYAELRHTAEELINEEHTATVDIKSTRDYMDTVCRSFASRLDRRRTLLITSVRFHRLAEEFSVKLDDLLEMLCSEIEAEDVPSAEAAIQNLNDKCENLDTLAYQTLNDGQSLLDEMSRPVKNAMGKDITPDYSSQIKHIQKRLEDLQERKLRCDELSDVRKLKLQQILQLRTCERDADQAINWILELCDVMAATHTKMGSTQEEAENLQMEHKKFETTAAGTYEYGKQLLQAGLVLRRSLRYNLAPNNERSHRLEEAWKRFSQGTNERANRLTVSAMFLASADKILDRVDDLLIPISWTMSGEATVPEVLRQYTPVKGQVERDHQETDHMGRALLERLAMPIILTEGREKTVSLDDHEAVEVISSKLSKMEQKLLDLNRYWSEMEKTKMPPASVQYGESRKRQPTRTKTFSGYDANRNKSQPSQKRQRRSTSDLGGPPAAPERAVRTREKPKPPERSGSLHHNVRPPVREVLVTRASSRPVNAGMTQSLPRNYRPSSPESLKQQLEEGAEWIRVRVHQMEPDLTDVGSTLEEALQLRQEHNEMLAKLKSKEDEIKNILASADAYAVENRSQADVYAAMAETLNEAWRELNLKLEHRSMLLDLSIGFHQSAQDFAAKMEQAQGKFTSMLPTQDVNTARHLLQQHQDIKKSILESSQATLQQGHSLLERIREMGMHADLQNRHATTAACYGIEHLLELLQDRRRRLEEIWEQRRIRLEQCLQLCQLDQETNKVLDWYRTTGSAYLHRTDLGDSYHHSQLIQEEHHRFEAQARQVQENVLRLVRKADQLLRRTNLDAEGVRQRLQTVDHECENFMVRLDTKRKNISMALSFFDLVEKALTTLDQIEVQLNTMDLPRNSAELADRHAQLSNVIVEASTPALREGRILLERVSRDDPGADGVRRKVTQLQDRSMELESLCKARRAEAWERSQTYLIFQEKYTEVHTWITKICQATLARHNSMGTSLTNAEDFLEIHEQLEQDIRDKNADVESLSEAGVNLVKSGDPEAQSAAHKVDSLCKQIQRLHRTVQVRIQISIVYVTFHKLVQQLANNMNGLEHIIKSETENLQDLTEDAVRHTEELWTKVTDTYNQLRDRGQDFLQSSSTIQDDSTIDIRSSTQTVEIIVSEYTERMTILSTTYESWTTHVNSSRQFKTQWHQFIQDARKTIDMVMKIENDFFPVIAGDLGSSVDTANRYQSQLEEFTPMFKRAQEEIERHLSTAELLSLKGNAKGQKDQIINELIKVRQRFTARIHEYQILLKMTIQFFRNLDQLDRLIERTEKEYMESDLPSELSQAESLLEEHKRKKQEVSSLINYTADEGEKIVVRVRQTDAEAAAQDDVERVLKVTAEYKQRWNQAWEEQEKRLKQNLQICQFNYDLRQIHSEIDELHQHLQARRGSYGNSLPAARMNSQAFKQFEMTVELIEKKIQNFSSTAELMVQERHDDAVHIDRELDLLKTKWTTFHTSVRNYRQLLECSVEYFNLYEESETWIKEGNTLLNDVHRHMNQCRSSTDAERLVSTLDKFIEKGRPVQESRLQRMSELVIELYGEEGPSRLHNLFVQNQELMQSFQQTENHIAQVKAQLKDREEGQPVAEEIQPMEVIVTASMPKAQPPRIIKPITDAEVMEGEKVTLECHVDSATTPEVMWYKDNLPLNSPDYETRYDRGVATLTIEETFSEDTARYTVRLTNEAGTAESSAYLHVRAMEKPIIHKMTEDTSIPEGKGVRLEVNFTGSPTPDVTWFRGQNRIVPSAVYKITIDINRCTLEIKEAFPEDSGTYTVVLQNAAGEIRRSCQVTVESFYSSTTESASLASTEIEAVPPSFMQHLSPAKEAMEGSRVRLDCILVGHPEPEVIWYKNDKPVKESKDIQLLFEGDRCTLCIREAYLEDSGTYRIVANNIHGQAESLCKLHVEPLSELSDASIGEMTSPRFSQPLRDFSVQSGHRVCLQCRITGHPIPEAKWYKDNKPIDNSPDYEITAFADVHNLTIPEAFEEDSGTYMVRAINLAGEAKCYCKLTVKTVSEPMEQEEVMRMKRVVETREMKVKVGREEVEHSPPEFQRLFQDLSVNAGDAVTLECSITGAPKPKVTWFFNGQPVVSRDYQITMDGNTHRLHIPEVFDEDAGRFSITAENPSGKATCSAVLNVDEEPAPKTRIFGSTEYTSRRVSHTETVTSRETRLSRTIMTAQREQQTYIPSSEQHATTIITDVKPQVPQLTAQEHYATTITTDLQPKYQPVDLTISVPVPPKFAQALKNIQAMEGSKVTFDGVVTGKPEPSIKWFRENRELTDQADFEISYKDGRVSLTIPEVFEEDAGKFTCTAKNVAGTASSSAELVIKASVVPPSFTQKLQSQDVGEGNPVRFTIKVSGQPPPEITWYKDGTKLTSSRDFEIIQEGDIHSLYIPEVFYEDAGKFSVTAENPAGKSQCQAELRIQAPMEETITPVQKPATQMPYGEPTASPKLQRPSDFMKKDVAPKTRSPAEPQKFTEQVEMEVAGDRELPMFEQRFRLFQKPEETAPPKQVSEVSFKPAVSHKQPPKFTKRLQDKTIKEGQRLVLEVCVEYKGPEPIIKWYREGLIIRNSPDYQITFENNTSRLSVAEVFPEDTGVYKCVATNADGSDSTEAMLRVIAPSPSQYEQMLVDERPDVASHVPMEEEKVPSPVEPQPPVFLESPHDFRLVEGTNAIFECRISGKPFPEITWRKRGFPIRNDARHRISIDEFNGRCSLVISNCKPDDAGDYTCTAINFAGETNSTAVLLPAEVKPPSPPPAPELPKTQPPTWQQKPWQQRTEPPAKKPWQQKETPQPSWAAVTEQFTQGEAPHRTDKGFVTSRSERILESNLEYRRSQEPEERPVTSTADFQPAGFEERLKQQNYIKDGRVKFSSETETSQSEYESEIDRSPVAQPSPPQITQRLKDFRLMEGSDATFVCRISGRPRPKVAWYLNGHRIKRSSRYEMKFTKDSYCTLRIRMALPEDAGHYTVLAVNNLGKDTCSSKLYVDRLGNIDATSFVAPETLDKILNKGKKDQAPEDEGGILEALSRPVFKKTPEDREVHEGNTVRLDTLVSGRPVPELSWFLNGHPVHNDDHHKIVVNEDGVNSLIILGASRYDSGTYKCVAKNKAGENTFTVTLKVMEKEQMQPPKFVERMQNFTVNEGQPVTLTCQVTGVPVPMISWQKDGKMLTNAGPYQIQTEGGRSTLTIPAAHVSDGAWFQCSAANVAGTASTRAKLNVQAKPKKVEPPKKKISISKAPRKVPSPPTVPQTEPWVSRTDSPPDLYRESAVREFIRREGQAPAEEDLYHKDKKRPPKFRTHIKNLTTLKENDSAHFECKLMPYGDPTMKVEWYKDNQPLHHGHRFKPMFEFGFVTLDILYTYPEDSGVYECRATNAHGTDVTQATIKCRGQQSIIAETQLPGEGALRLQEMEENWRRPAHLDEREMEEPKMKYPPSIDMKPEPVEVAEGEPAKFMVKVSGYPRPRVTWWVNGTMIMTSSRFKIRYDGMMNYMDIPRVREYDSGQIRVVAKNTEGEAEASTVLNVLPKEDWRSQLRQAPKGELEIELDRKRKIELKNVEFKRPFEIPKSADYELKQIERAHETRIKMKHEKEMYMKADSKFMSHPKPDQPARVVRPDRPEIQMEIQKARMVPVIPEQSVPTEESNISETQIVLERREPPVFIKPLRPLRVTEGTPITIEVQFKGYPPPIISWYRDNFEIHPSHDFQINTTESTSSLHIPEVFPEDTGMFMVKAYNMYGTVQCKAKLTVVEEEDTTERVNSPEFRNLIHDINTVMGEPATFDCQVTGRPKPTVQWRKDGKPLEESPRWKFIEEEDNYTLLIYEAQPEDVGQYDCVALNTVGKATCTAKLNMEIPVKSPEPMEPLTEIPAEAPTVTSEPQNLIVDEGEPATFTCKIKGSPAPIVSWYRNNQLIKPSKYFRMESSPDGTHSLSILEAFPEDSGNYRCVARNKAGETTCGSLLKVQGLESDAEAPSIESRTQPPSFNQPITNTLVVEGSTARFEARFSGVPPPEITWLRNGLQVIHNSKNYQIEVNPTSTILTIKQAFPEDSGLITCRIKNISGTTECSAELYVQEELPKGEEEAQPLAEVQETPDLLEGLDTQTTEKVVPEKSEISTIETTGSDVVTSETEEVSFEIVTAESAETTPLEFTVQTESARPEKTEVPLKAAVPEVSEVVAKETEELISKDVEEEKPVEEVIAMEELLRPEEELPVSHTIPQEEDVEEVVKDEAAPEIPKGEAPVFTTTLEKLVVQEGQPVQFRCVVSGIPKPDIVWLLDDAVIEDSATYQTECSPDGTCTLTIDKTVKEDEGEYVCQATNPEGSAATMAELVMTEEAEIKPQDITSDFNITLQQEVQDQHVEHIDTEFTLKETLSEKEQKFEEDKEVTSEEEKPESPIPFVVEEREEKCAPEVVAPLKSIQAADGGQARLECQIHGVPKPTVTWYRDDQMIVNSEEFKIFYDEDNLCSLFIPDVYPEDAGRYTVVAKNELGTAETTAELFVAASDEVLEDEFIAPAFTQKPKFQTASLSETVTFEATVVANPQPQIHWSKENEEMTPSDRVTITTDQDGNIYHTTLTLNSIEPEDAGTFKVLAQNDQGEASISVSLLVKKPEGPQKTDFRDSLTTEVRTKVGIKYQPEQKDFRTMLKTTSTKSKKFSQDVTEEETTEEIVTTEQVDFREVLKKTVTSPQFVVTIEDLTSEEGGEAKFTVKVKGEPTPEVMWFHENEPIKDDDIYKIMAGEQGEVILHLPEVFPEDAGVYTVKAVNEAGEVSCSAVLTVLQEELEGTEEMKEAPKPEVAEETPAKPFTMPDAEQLDFRAVLKSKVKTKTNETFETEQLDFRSALKTKVKTKVNEQFHSEQLDFRGALKSEHVETKVNQQFHYEQLDFREVLKQDTVETKVNQQFPHEQLDFRSVLKTDRDSSEEITQEETVIEVPHTPAEEVPQVSQVQEKELVAPKFVTRIDDIKAQEGEEVKFIVKVTGTPTPEVTWHHDNEVIKEDSEIYRVVQGEEGEVTLLLTEAFPEDSGVYTVTASNKAGQAECTAMLTITELVEEEEEALEEQVETIESKEVIKQEAAVKIQSMFRGFKAREEVKHMKEAKDQQEVPTFEADTTFDISDISTDTEVTAQLPGDDHPQGTQQHMHAQSKDYDVGTKVYTWRLESTPIDLQSPQYDTHLFKEEVTVTGPESEDIGYLPSDEEAERTKTVEDETSTWHVTGEEEEVPALPSTSAPELTTDSTLLSSRPDRTSDDFTSIPSSTVPEGTEETFTFVTAEDLPDKGAEEEFTVLSKEDIPPLQLGISSSDEKEGSEKSYPDDFTSSDDSSAEKRLATNEEQKLLSKEDKSDKERIPQQKLVDEVSPRSKSETSSSSSGESDMEDGFVKPSMPDIVPKSSEIHEKGVSSESEDEGKVEVDVTGVPLTDSDKESPKSQKREISKSDKDRPEEQLLGEEIILPSEDKPDFAFERLIEEGKDQVPMSMVDKVSLWDEESEDDERKLRRNFSPLDKSVDEQPQSEIIEEYEEEFTKPDFVQQVSLEERQKPEADLPVKKGVEEREKTGQKDLVDLSFDKLLMSPTEQPGEMVFEDTEQPVLYKQEALAPEFEISPKDIFHAERKHGQFRGVQDEEEDYEEASFEEEEIVEEEDAQDEFMGRDYVLENIPEEESFETSENEGYPGEEQQLSPEQTLTKPSKGKTTEDVEASLTLKEGDLEMPSFLRELSDQEVTEDDTVTFIVQVSGTPFPEITWFKDGVEIESDDHFITEVRGNFASLIIKDVVIDDDAEYVVKANNEAGTVTSKGELFVNPSGEAPSIISRIEDIEVEPSASIVLECQVRGHPKPKVTWLKDGEEVSGPRYRVDFVDDIVSLEIAEAEMEDEGEYTLSLTNDKGVASCSSMVMVQLDKPVIMHPLTNVTVSVADTARLECEVIGKPTPDIVWLANQTVIHESPKYHMSYDGTTAVLEIQDTGFNDAEVTYTCRAQNLAGESETTAQIELQGIL